MMISDIISHDVNLLAIQEVEVSSYMRSVMLESDFGSLVLQEASSGGHECRGDSDEFAHSM